MMEAEERGGESLLVERDGQHVACQLPRNELIVGQVLIDCGNNPIAIGPHVALAIGLESIRVGRARQQEPVYCDSFAKLR